MTRLFKHYLPCPVLFTRVAEFCVLMVAAEFAWVQANNPAEHKGRGSARRRALNA